MEDIVLIKAASGESFKDDVGMLSSLIKSFAQLDRNSETFWNIFTQVAIKLSPNQPLELQIEILMGLSALSNKQYANQAFAAFLEGDLKLKLKQPLAISSVK
jgi:hypothetical protein